MILSDRSCRIRTRELEEKALRIDWTIETDRGGRRTAIPRMDHTTGALAQRKFENKRYEVLGAAQKHTENQVRNFEKYYY